MNRPNHRFWPFRPQASIIAAIVLLLVLLVLVAVLRYTIQWPTPGSENVVLIGILVISLMPILLSVLDVMMERGASIGYGNFKIDFSNVSQSGVSGITMPANIGVPGLPVADSDTTKILDSLRKATSSDIIVIDLEEGSAWWETRLLVLIAGATRLGRPQKMVFLGNEANKEQTYQGWGYSRDLLRCLLEADPLYYSYYHMSRAAALQWEMVEPLEPVPPLYTSPRPVKPMFITGMVAMAHEWMAFENSGKRNELFAEQILQSKLGQEIEKKKTQVKVTISRLQEIFRPVLNKDTIDQKWPMEKQLQSFFESTDDYLAITANGKYTGLVSRIIILSELLSSVVNEQLGKKQTR